MALSLSAEQKNIKNIFLNEDQYIIPNYQRPYSWEYDQCYQLYTDIMNAFNETSDYFIGNIITAISDENKNCSYVVDGQQRIITIWLMVKALHMLYPEKKILKKLLEIESWDGDVCSLKIDSRIFEAKDNEHIKKISLYVKNDFETRLSAVSDKQNRIQERKCNSQIEANALFFYFWFKSFIAKADDSLKEKYIKFLLESVYLLPIQLTGKNQEEANDKALMIFETINNRGMNLEDADIFKAKLYNKSEKLKEGDIFINEWINFKSSCDSLQLKIDDIFRLYSHIIRGAEGITVNEKNLREFFIRESFSPFSFESYSVIMNNLFRILEILEYLNQEKSQSTEIGTWLHILDAYTNQYPKYAIVNYLYVNDWKENNNVEFISFLKSLVRYVYFQGSTTTVKFEIYNIIKQTSQKINIGPYYRPDISIEYFNSFGRLKKGFALLAHYLMSHIPISVYAIDKLIEAKEFEAKKFEWGGDLTYSDVDNLGNIVILDIPRKIQLWDKKREYYKNSEIHSVTSLSNYKELSYQLLSERDMELKTAICEFFKGDL